MLTRLKRSPLALRIYLVGVAQIAVVLLGFVAFARLNRPPPPGELHAEERALAEAVNHHLDDPQAIDRLLIAAREPSGLEATVIAPDKTIIASTVPSDAPPCVRPSIPPRPEHAPPPPEGRPPPPEGRPPPHEGRPPPPEGMPPPAGRPPPHEDAPPPPERVPPPPAGQPGCYTIALSFPNGGIGYIELRRTHPTQLSPFNPLVISFVLLVVAVSSLLLARSFARPLQKLATTARTLGSGNLAARVNIDRADELGEVARAFDDMAARITDLVHAEKELVANVSHELRTPLARIRVALDIASEGDAATIQESLADIADDLAELERLVTDVVTAARLDLAAEAPRGIPPLRKEHVSLDALLSHAATRFRTAYPERTLTLHTADDLPAVEGDPVLLRRVVDNLLDNAHKYTEGASSPVELTATQDGSEALIEVRDHGVGISAQDLSGVFRPFFRVDRSRTRATGGLGLGLALVKRIVDAHHGSIVLQSQPGEGTIASVRLPATPHHQPTTAASKPS